MKRKALSISALLICVIVIMTGCTNAFKSDDFCKVLQKHGETKFRNLDSFNSQWGYSSSSSSSVLPNVDGDINPDGTIKTPTYYISKDSEEADLMFKDQIDQRNEMDIYLEEMVIAHPNDRDLLYFMNAKQEYSAQDIYDYFASLLDEFYDEYKEEQSAAVSSGNKNGYSYKIAKYKKDDLGECGGGIYKKGNTIILIDTSNGDDFFFKELGLVSPFDMK